MFDGGGGWQSRKRSGAQPAHAQRSCVIFHAIRMHCSSTHSRLKRRCRSKSLRRWLSIDCAVRHDQCFALMGTWRRVGMKMEPNAEREKRKKRSSRGQFEHVWTWLLPCPFYLALLLSFFLCIFLVLSIVRESAPPCLGARAWMSWDQRSSNSLTACTN